jgi:hypothetical protein
MKPRDDATPEVPIPATHAAQQVAYAWQVAARELRFTHPELHAHLTERVRKLLDVEVLDDPAIDIQKLQALNTAVRRELEELRQALADARNGAVPIPPNKLRPEPAAPTREILQAVADGTRTLTPEEREWCVTEAMVLTGFLKTPVELLQAGEPALARIILDGQSTAP